MAPASRLNSVYRKAESITRDMRDRIVAGEYTPGSRLPTREALTSHYGVSKVTVQRALDTLSQEGFVVSDGRRGTFVAEDCPHLTRYALLFPAAFESGPCNQFWKALAHEAEQLGPAVRFKTIWGFESRAGFQQYEEILADVEADRLAGLIFANSPVNLGGTPLVERPGVPRTAIMSSPMPGIPAVEMDTAGFIDLALDELVAQGRRRPAVLCAPAPGKRIIGHLTASARSRRISLEPKWIQAASIVYTDWAERLVELILDRPEADRPDSMIILDDNLLEPAARGVRRAGVSVPDELALISMCNFPWPTPSCLPVTRIGFSVTDCLRACVETSTASASISPSSTINTSQLPTNRRGPNTRTPPNG